MRTANYYRVQGIVRLAFWAALAAAFFFAMDAVTPESCESAATFTKICI